ncbi:MAG: hypothetical protein A2168_05450 [Planctomycetes bacterium RBG_13_50_24]|nr:MAG: hypothetical protein A2168_05450 [Planctomycetes bacterium RBG_13_50_24]
MPAGRKAGTASPQTTIGMRLPPDRIDGKRVAASKPQALGMVENARGRLNMYKLKALGMVNIGETIPNPFNFAQGSAAFEAATLTGYQIKFDRVIVFKI